MISQFQRFLQAEEKSSEPCDFKNYARIAHEYKKAVAQNNINHMTELQEKAYRLAKQCGLMEIIEPIIRDYTPFIERGFMKHSATRNCDLGG